ncbi:hypothetical protein P0D88_33245 [Paraburkholderia sp. RL18-103-BIB-C]|uniref:hypothetical protein n=1 Tax=unclassified Paraburkholderia TaxID=2615204 RepID=UPI0038BD7E78
MCNRDTKKIRMAALPALILALFPLTSRADVGSLAGVVLIAFWIALAIWSALTLGVFLLLRRRTVFTRFAATALFFFAPVLLVAGMWFGEELQYEHYVQARERTLVSRSPFQALSSKSHLAPFRCSVNLSNNEGDEML